MKTWHILLILLFSLAFANGSENDYTSIIDLENKSIKLYKEKKYNRAKEIYLKLLDEKAKIDPFAFNTEYYIGKKDSFHLFANRHSHGSSWSNIAEANLIISRIESISDKVLEDKNHILYAGIYYDMSLIYDRALKNPKKAKEYALKSLSILLSNSDISYPSLSLVYDQLAIVEKSLGNIDRFEHFGLRALKEKMTEHIHMDTVKNISVIYAFLGIVKYSCYFEKNCDKETLKAKFTYRSNGFNSTHSSRRYEMNRLNDKERRVYLKNFQDYLSYYLYLAYIDKPKNNRKASDRLEYIIDFWFAYKGDVSVAKNIVGSTKIEGKKETQNKFNDDNLEAVTNRLKKCKSSNRTLSSEACKIDELLHAKLSNIKVDTSTVEEKKERLSEVENSLSNLYILNSHLTDKEKVIINKHFQTKEKELIKEKNTLEQELRRYKTISPKDELDQSGYVEAIISTMVETENGVPKELIEFLKKIPKTLKKTSSIGVNRNNRNIRWIYNPNHFYLEQLLDKETIYIDYATTNKHTFIFSVRNKTGDTITLHMIENSQLEKTIKRFQETKSQESLSELYQLLLGNPLGNILKKYKKIIISKDGATHKIPFEALYNEESKKYFIEEKELLYVSSAQEFFRLQDDEPIKNNGKIILFSNPNFQAEVNNKMGELRGSKIAGLDDLPAFQEMKGFEEEAKSISSIFPNITINYEGDNASEENLFKIKSPKILHFATHGFFIDDKTLSYSNLKSGIALSGYNSSRNGGESYEGIVTASKLLQLDLKGTELVVFSACDTGVGDIQDSEGIEGLNKVVVQVGAKRVMMSLWKVNDKQTTKLMRYYYQFLKEKKSYAEALRETKLKMINEGIKPKHWSAFVLNGID